MGPLNKAIDEIHFRIPRQILDTIFIRRDMSWRQNPISVDEHILNEIIRPRVLVDCNLIGGTEAFIKLEGVPVTRTNDYTSVYRIPKDKTQGRTIISVLNVTFTDPNRASSYGIGATENNSAMMQAGRAAMDAMGDIPITSTARVQLIGENVVMVRDSIILSPNSYLRCILANDENMSHLQMKSYRQFANLCILATKAYIYNEYIIQMDMGELHGGQQLGKFKEIIEGYADSEELYQTYLTEKWQKISVMNDSESYTRILKMMIGGSR